MTIIHQPSLERHSIMWIASLLQRSKKGNMCWLQIFLIVFTRWGQSLRTIPKHFVLSLTVGVQKEFQSITTWSPLFKLSIILLFQLTRWMQTSLEVVSWHQWIYPQRTGLHLLDLINGIIRELCGLLMGN